MLSLKDFKSFEVSNKSFFGGQGRTEHTTYDEDWIEGDVMYGADGGLHFALGCKCPNTTAYSPACC